MRNIPSIAAGPAKSLALELKAIWNVQADRTYRVMRTTRPRELVAVRTLSGEGTIQMDNSAAILALPGTLLLIEESRLAGYFCSGENWEFWWFHFSSSDPLPCAFSTPYRINGASNDNADFNETFTRLQSRSYPVRCVASSIFCTMLQRWLAEASISRSPTKHREVIEMLIERIHGDISADWSLARLAWESGLCESLLRREFKNATGKPPARFVHEARLQAASQLIQQGVYTLSAIAEMTNFSSAFHLSAAFKKHFGVSPSLVRKQ
jgi:AraC-like DNA-binding protein